MKINKILLTLFAGSMLVSCGDNLADLNTDPNSSISGGTGPEAFTSAIGYYGIVLDANFNQNNALYAQYWAGGPGVAILDHERYFFEPADFNAEWNTTYLQTLSDLDYVKENGNEDLAAISEIFTALVYQNLVDHYGDVPYFDAMNGEPSQGGVLSPVYDDSKAIYDDLILRIDAAVAVLRDPLTEHTVADEDLIYGGDVDSWIAFANSLKLRLLMRQSITDPSVGPAVIELIANETFIEDEAGLARIQYGGAEGSNYNPQYARAEASLKMFYVASQTTTALLTGLNDPRGLRLFAPAAGTGTLVGLKQGNINDVVSPKKADYSFPSAVAYGIANDVILMSHWEVMFLRAEADMRFGTNDDETAMYNAAVSAHFDYVGLTPAQAATYLAAEGSSYDAAAPIANKSQRIGVQKWISMNGLQESEGWIESRRFDEAGTNIFTKEAGIFVTPTRSTLGANKFPSIRLYPQSEISFNKNTPKGRVVTDKVFWDN